MEALTCGPTTQPFTVQQPASPEPQPTSPPKSPPLQGPTSTYAEATRINVADLLQPKFTSISFLGYLILEIETEAAETLVQVASQNTKTYTRRVESGFTNINSGEVRVSQRKGKEEKVKGYEKGLVCLLYRNGIMEKLLLLISKIVKWKILRHGDDLVDLYKNLLQKTTAYGPEEDLERAFAGKSLGLSFDPKQSEETVWNEAIYVVTMVISLGQRRRSVLECGVGEEQHLVEGAKDWDSLSKTVYSQPMDIDLSGVPRIDLLLELMVNCRIGLERIEKVSLVVSEVGQSGVKGFLLSSCRGEV
ncbi:hypothetical protein Tco_1482537 [Tanacetum coccineum]